MAHLGNRTFYQVPYTTGCIIAGTQTGIKMLVASHVEVSNNDRSHFGMIQYHILEAPVKLKSKASWDVGVGF